MHFFGLHWIDGLIIVAYIIAVLAIGKILSHGVKDEKDFFLGGRSLGKWFQFFLSFGTMTDPGQATTTSSSATPMSSWQTVARSQRRWPRG